MHTEKKRGEREKEGEGKEFYSFQYFPGGPLAAQDLWSYPARGPTGWLKILLAKNLLRRKHALAISPCP